MLHAQIEKHTVITLKTLIKKTVDIRFLFSHLLCKIDSMQEQDGSKQSFDETGIA